MSILPAVLIGVLALFLPIAAFASGTADHPDLTLHPAGLAILLIFSGGLCAGHGRGVSAPAQIQAGGHRRRRHLGHARLCLRPARRTPRGGAGGAARLLEYAELMLFLLVAMTYINAMAGAAGLRCAARLADPHAASAFASLFWMTGTLAFFISPIADNLTTALLMCAVVMAVGGENRALRHPGLHQYRGGGQRRRRLQPLRRHHHPDGLAEGDHRLLRLLRAVHPRPGELARPGAS